MSSPGSRSRNRNRLTSSSSCTARRSGPSRTRRAGSSSSRLRRYVGRTEEAMTVGREAVAVLERLPGHELAMAYCNVSHLHQSVENADETIAWGTRALDLAESLDDAEALVYALTNIGT